MGRHKKEDTTILYARLPVKLYERVKADAYKQGREISGHIRFVIERYYETETRKHIA